MIQNPNASLVHMGVMGMKWGKRRGTQNTPSLKTQARRAKIDDARAAMEKGDLSASRNAAKKNLRKEKHDLNRSTLINPRKIPEGIKKTAAARKAFKEADKLETDTYNTARKARDGKEAVIDALAIAGTVSLAALGLSLYAKNNS